MTEWEQAIAGSLRHLTIEQVFAGTTDPYERERLHAAWSAIHVPKRKPETVKRKPEPTLKRQLAAEPVATVARLAVGVPVIAIFGPILAVVVILGIALAGGGN